MTHCLHIDIFIISSSELCLQDFPNNLIICLKSCRKSSMYISWKYYLLNLSRPNWNFSIIIFTFTSIEESIHWLTNELLKDMTHRWHEGYNYLIPSQSSHLFLQSRTQTFDMNFDLEWPGYYNTNWCYSCQYLRLNSLHFV